MDAEVARNGDGRGQRDDCQQGATRSQRKVPLLKILHLPHDPGDRGWLGGGESYRWKDMWAQELHPGDACLPQVPAVLGCHMAGGPS